MFRNVLHFCSKISFMMNFDAKLVPFRVSMEADFDTFCDCREFLGVLCLMLFFEVHFLSLRSSKPSFLGTHSSPGDYVSS